MTEPSLLEQGQKFLEDFELLEAEEAFRQAMQAMPHEPEVYLGMTRLLLLRGEPEKAQGMARQAASLTEDKAEAEALIAACEMQLDRVDEAISMLKRTNQWHPNHPLVLSNLGKAMAMVGEYDKAREYSTKALELGAAREEVEHDLGIICSGLHDFEAAVDHFVASIEANPTYLPSYFRLGQFAKLLGLVDDTIQLFEDGVSLMPDMVQLREELHVLYMVQQDVESAMREALELAARRGWAEDYLRVGNTALLMEDMESARVAYETAVEVDPTDMGAHLNLGHWHRLMKQREEAMDRYKLVAEAYPELYKPYLGLALTYMELDEDYRKARLCLMKAVELEPQSYDVLIHLAACSAKLDEREDAENYAKVAMGLAETPRERERALEILEAPGESDG